ncbi:MAG: riboflavin synthase [Gammaproteobacteria bacterium]|nr:riboflavin synthase [Gammaproteobacteria bacterium]
MFTGIIQATGIIRNINSHDKGSVITFQSSAFDFSQIKIGDSIAVNGVCLTVISFDKDFFVADLSQETLNCTSYKDAFEGKVVNMESALKLNQGIDGHLVSGHVDGIAKINDKYQEGESFRFQIEAPEELRKYIAKKGSVTLDGISLTVNNINEKEFNVNIVPHTLENTNLSSLEIGDKLNIEVDMIARYVEQLTKA